MPDPLLVVILVGVALMLAYLLAPRDRASRRRRSLLDPPDQVITSRRFSPWGWWGGSDLVYHPERLIRPRGRRRVARGLKERGGPDPTLEGKDPLDERA